MMKHLASLLLWWMIAANSLFAQDTTEILFFSKSNSIAVARRALDTAFLSGDLPTASLWIDSLTRLEDENYVALVWDERWLLYYWTGTLSNVLDEVARFDQNERIQQSWKTQPPGDSLFEHLDRWMFEQRFLYFNEIGQAFLNQEEKTFATMLLEYMLRLNSDRKEWNTKIENFLMKYPASRFSTWLQNVKPYIPKPSDDAVGLFGSFKHGQWSDQLERTARPLNALEIGFYYWKNRMNYQISGAFGGGKLEKDVYEDGYAWPKGEYYSSVMFYAEVGYDILNNKKMRIFPTLGGGYNNFRPPSSDDEEDPNPEYYSLFHYPSAHLLAVLNLDVKLFDSESKNSASQVPGSYHGPRLRVGYQRLFWGSKNPALRGNMFFVSAGWNLHAVQPR